jgi:transposase-like protein
MPRKLVEKLAETFRRANWHETDGTAICPRCFDGKDLIILPQRGVINGVLRRYYCKCCIRKFSDQYGTPLETARTPIQAWALLALKPPTGRGLSYGEMHRVSGVAKDNLLLLHRRMKGSPFVARWREELTKAGVTIEQLRAAKNGGKP